MKKGKAGLIMAAFILLAAFCVIIYYILMPVTEDRFQKHNNNGISILEKYAENPDMIGWIQVEGTDINYPVMRGEQYLYKNFEGKDSSSGTPFVDGSWNEDSLNTLIYGHNMWMYKSMFNPIHNFETEKFFEENDTIKFYVIGDGEYVEKKVFEISHCILTDIRKWDYSQAQHIKTQHELDEYIRECDMYAKHKRNATGAHEKVITLSTCSYHIRGDSGRIVLVGTLIDTVKQNYLDDVRR